MWPEREAIESIGVRFVDGRGRCAECLQPRTPTDGGGVLCRDPTRFEISSPVLPGR